MIVLYQQNFIDKLFTMNNTYNREAYRGEHRICKLKYKQERLEMRYQYFSQSQSCYLSRVFGHRSDKYIHTDNMPGYQASNQGQVVRSRLTLTQD